MGSEKRVAYLLVFKNKQVINLTTVDYDLFDELSLYKWYLHTNGYVCRYEYEKESGKGKQKRIYLHRFINKTQEGFDTDHVDMNKLNNTTKNLRSVTKSQNQMNTKTRSHNKSGYKGVSKVAGKQKWYSRITVNKKVIRLGYFDTPEAAYMAYTLASKIYHKGFGRE